MKRKIAAIFLSGMLMVSVAGCGNKDSKSSSKMGLDGSSVKTDTLTYWMPLNPNLTASVSNFGETEYAKEIEKRTGVKVEYIHPAAGQQVEAFNLMIASGELADMIQSNWLTYSGGPQKAISDEVIIPLNDYLKDYAPAFNKFLSENKEIAREVKDDNGDYYVFPMLKLDDELRATVGPAVRADWLKELNLEVPETIDEWENVLREFKTKKNSAAPMSFNYAYVYKFVNMFGTDMGILLDGDEMLFVPLTKQYKEALMRMSKWYKEGLLDKNIASVDEKMLDSNILNNKTGAAIMLGGSGLGKYLDNATTEGFDLTAAKMPGLEKGVDSDFSFLTARYNQGASVAVSTKCENPELAVKYLDYLYTDEGHMLANFGIEGVSYEMKDGKPAYTDLIMKNPDGLSMSNIMPMYFRSSNEGPFIQDVEYIRQYYSKPQQQEAIKLWSRKKADSQIESVPPITPSLEESEEYANIMANVNKHNSEMFIKFITGIESFDNYDKFLKRFDELNIKRALEIQQNAYKRFKDR